MITVFIGQGAPGKGTGQGLGGGVRLKLGISDLDHSCPCHGENHK